MFILTELGHSPYFTREQLNLIAADPRFDGNELQQAAVWALGKAGLKCYEDLLPFIDNADENLAFHAIVAFSTDTPRPVINRLVQDLKTNDPRRAPAASEALRIIASNDVLQALVAAADTEHPVADWILATLGRLPPNQVRAELQGAFARPDCTDAAYRPWAHWLASEAIGADIAFLLKQHLC